MSFGVVTYAGPDGPRVGVLAGEQIADAEPVLAAVMRGRIDMQAVLDAWEAALPRLMWLADDVAAGKVRGTLARAETRLLAPLPRPANIYNAFANYVDHMIEMGGQPADKTQEDPFLFQTPSTAVTDPEAPIILPPGMDRTDWEGELAAIIGQPGRDLSVDEALMFVAGYTIIHDVSIRSSARRGDTGGRPDFIARKGRATFKPMGPALIPAHFIPDPQSLRLRTWVSGELKQDSSTAQMIYSTAEQIAHISRLTGVVPGDLFATGTPAGVGMPKGTFLKHGDVVEIEIEGIGRLRTPVVQQPAG
jgi:2-keto-4-pentenoate hydratase/2-oxohepta-3-ene-1,7-dioic acid hydratase in catechol pathway